MTRAIVDGRSRRRKAWDRLVPMYPVMHPIFGTWEEHAHEGEGRRAVWWWSLRRWALGFDIVTRAEHSDQGYPYEGWQLTVYLGPATVEVHGADGVEEEL